MDDVRSSILLRSIDPDLPVDPDTLQYYYYSYRFEGNQVPALMNTAWGEMFMYGQFCPNGIAGCVATAISQIMTFHQKPASITISTDMGSVFTLGQQVVLPWQYMNEHEQVHYTTESCTPYHSYISALLRDVGENVNTDYGYNSSANIADIPSCLSHYGYQYDVTASADITMIISSLNCQRPVYMQGGGHAWVADGYKDYAYYRDKYAQAYPEPGYYLVESILIDEAHALHINWGWDGVCNGYFNFNTYNTNNAISYDYNGGNYGNFTGEIYMITNIR